MKVNQLTIRGVNQWNEDALIVQEASQVFGVLDGATSFVPFRGAQGETGGYLASAIIKKYLEHRETGEWQSLSLRQAILAANEQLRKVMLEQHVDCSDKKQLWSAGIAVVRITDNQVHYAQVGDCMILAVYKDGSIRTLTRDQIDHLDRETRRRWQEATQYGRESMEDRYKVEASFILRNKLMMNTMEGYAILNGEPEVSDFIECGSINRIHLTDLILITDGLFPLSEQYDASTDFNLLVQKIKQNGLNAFAQGLLELENTDAECLKYPRIKTSDDKTAIWIQL